MLRNASPFLLLLAAGASLAGAEEARSGRVNLAAQAPVVTLPGVPPGRHSVDLPRLEYTFDITAECGGGVPESLAISVADSRATLSANELAAASPLRLVLTVPASQTPPLSLADFCAVAPETPGLPPAAAARRAEHAGPPTLEIPDVLSAQVSLVCSHGEERRMSWFSQPLPVTLACGLSGGAPAGADR